MLTIAACAEKASERSLQRLSRNISPSIRTQSDRHRPAKTSGATCTRLITNCRAVRVSAGCLRLLRWRLAAAHAIEQHDAIGAAAPAALPPDPTPPSARSLQMSLPGKTKSTVATRSRQLGASRPPWNDTDKSRSREARARQQLRVPLRGVPRGTRRHDDIEREQRPARPRRQHAPGK